VAAADDLIVTIDREKRVIRTNLTRLEVPLPQAPPVQLNNPPAPAPPALAFARAPELKRGTFGGNILEWPAYWGTFRPTIHENPNLDDLTKLVYLLEDQVGESKEATNGFVRESRNYPEVVAFIYS
jgi:hypothetical protein